MKEKVSKVSYVSKAAFLLIFVILGFIALQIPVNVLAGAKVKFTLFDLFAPISGAFLGSTFGVVAVLAMQIVNLATHGFTGVQTGSFLKLVATLRFLPLIFGVLYFAGKRQYSSSASEKSEVVSSRFARTIEVAVLIIPIISIIAFILHPIGRTVWFYSLFWLIPIAVYPLREKFLIARSLGSTFTAHAVGGAVWIWAFNLPASVWISLIPVVILERAIFALGISAAYILMNNVLAFSKKQKILTTGFSLDKKYILQTLNAKR